jgi:DNA-binding NarL/FixJ family response regulator
VQDGRMKPATTVDPLSAGRRALAAGDWSAAAAAFELAATTVASADAFGGLGLARWWLRDVEGAIDARTRAYSALLREARSREAARTAVWLAREYRTVRGGDPVADGWLARARKAGEAHGEDDSHGWIALAEGEAATDPFERIARVTVAAARARAVGDADLEIVALARLAVEEVSVGRVETGLAHLDEAMAAATAGEGLDPQSIGEACCALMDASGLLGDFDRVRSWATPIEHFQALYNYPHLSALGVSSDAPDVLSAFCGTCCGGLHLVTGRLDDAEASLVQAIDELRNTGMRPRCLHPAFQLAELRVVQGRFEEAESLLTEFGDQPECVRPLAALELARGSAAHAAARLRTAIGEAGAQEVVALPLWMLKVDADLAVGDVVAAEQGAAEIARVADMTGSARHRAQATFAQAKVAAVHEDDDAVEHLRTACVRLAEAQAALDACRARLAYARAMVEHDRPVAVTEARAALTALDRLGATIDADHAAAFLRELGIKGRTGDKDSGLLSTREQQVLRLVAEGLTNREIAQRLQISVKTAGHHVSNILMKLGLRSRTEAAAYAVLHPPS